MAQGGKDRKLHRLAASHRTERQQYLETTETPKGHMNQTQKNIRSTKAKPTTWEQPTQSPLEEPNTSQLTGKKVRDVFTRVSFSRGAPKIIV